jgi:tetratricopeptide (TPR) repeat protein
MNSDVINRGIRFLVLGSLAIFCSACGPGFQVSGDVAQGQTALFAGNYPGALGYFQSAAQADPNYISSSGQLREGILSFLGRTQYLNGQLEAARDTLQKAVAQQGSDNNVTLAQLYLGVTLARLNDRQAGLRDIESGTKGILDFLNYIQQNFRYSSGRLWDRGDEIRKAADAILALIAGGNFDWPTLISNSEALAMKFEREAYENQ